MTARTAPGESTPLVRWLALAAILLGVAALFAPVLGFPFLSLDDYYGVVANPGIRELSWERVRFLFLEDQRDFRWFPVAYLSFAVDHALAGLDPRAFHRTNLLLHLANTALVFALVRALFRDAIAAATTALLFGIHPLQVEAVAWVSSRKTLLFVTFFLLAALAYLRAAREGAARAGRRAAWLAGSVALFFLSMAAKATAVTLPAALVLVDHQRAPARARRPLAFLRASLPSKLLYLPVVAIAWAMTRALARRSPFLRAYAFDGFDWAVIVAHNLVYYLAKALAPIRLGAFYPLPNDDAGWLPASLYVFALLALPLLGLAAWSWGRRPRLAFGLGWYLVTILPAAVQPAVLGDPPLLAADRYFYQASIGPFFLVGAGAAALWRQRASLGRAAQLALAGAAAAALAALALATTRAIPVWRGTIPLYEHTVRHHPSDAFYYRLAIEYADEDRLGSAFRALELAERAPHRVFFAHLFVDQWRISDLYRRKGDDARAAAFLERAIRATPNALEPARTDTPLAWRYLAHLYERAGDPARAAEARARADRARPAPEHYFESHWFNTAPEVARAVLEARVAEAPDDAVAWYYLGRLDQLEDDPARARERLQRAARLGFVPGRP